MITPLSNLVQCRHLPEHVLVRFGTVALLVVGECRRECLDKVVEGRDELIGAGDLALTFSNVVALVVLI